MRMKQIKKSLSLIFCMMLIVAMALCISGCDDKQTEEVQSEETSVEEITELGEGKTQFLFIVVDKEGTETLFEIHTEKEIVGDALLELGLIEGEEGDFGLFVKAVNGIAADYDIDKTYWAFYINGEYAMSGVDTTTVEEGASYMFKVEK